MMKSLNKAIKPNDQGGKPSSVGTHTDAGDSLRKAAEAAEATQKGRHDNREYYLKGIADAQAAQKAAAQAKEDATTEAELDQACEAETRAKEKEAFFRRQLERLDFTPRMEEKEYYGHVAAVTATVEKAAADFRKVADRALAEIVAAQEAYLQTAKEANDVLIALDAAANVLQSKYRYHEIHLLNMPSVFQEDPFEWPRHAIRYTEGKAYDIIARGGADADYNKAACAAWHAAETVKRRS